MDMSFTSGNEHGLVLTSDVEKASFDRVWAWHDHIQMIKSGNRHFSSVNNGDTLDFYCVKIAEMIIDRDYIRVVFHSEPSTYTMTFENVSSTRVCLEDMFHNVGYGSVYINFISFHFKRDGDKRVFSYCINNE